MNLRIPQLLNWYSSTIMSSHISLFSVSLATVVVHHSVYSIAYLTRDRVRAQKKDDSTRSFVQKIRMIMAVTMTVIMVTTMVMIMIIVNQRHGYTNLTL